MHQRQIFPAMTPMTCQ